MLVVNLVSLAVCLVEQETAGQDVFLPCNLEILAMIDTHKLIWWRWKLICILKYLFNILVFKYNYN